MYENLLYILRCKSVNPELQSQVRTLQAGACSFLLTLGPCYTCACLRSCW